MSRSGNVRLNPCSAKVRTWVSLFVTLLVVFVLRGAEAFNSNKIHRTRTLPHVSVGGWGTRSKSRVNESNKISSSKQGAESSTAKSADSTAVVDAHTSNSSPDGSNSEDEPISNETNDFPDDISTFEAASEYLAASRAYTENGIAITDSTTKPTSSDRPNTVREYLPSLLKMCRPSNLPGVVMLHLIASRLAMAPNSSSFWLAIIRPSHLLTLTAILSTSCTSMAVNDYYDSRKRLSRGIDAPAPVIKRFLNYTYAMLLTALCFLPGRISRASVVFGTLLTFYYTQHLKPKTWIKNLTCAGVMGLAPLTSAAATWYLQSSNYFGIANVLRLSAVIFFGSMGREIWMDLSDFDGDRRENIRTVPVVYGQRLASRVVMGFQILMSLLAVGAPVLNLISGNTARVDFRRALLSSVGAGMILRRAINVVSWQGLNNEAVRKAVEESKLALFIVLGSFV